MWLYFPGPLAFLNVERLEWPGDEATSNYSTQYVLIKCMYEGITSALNATNSGEEDIEEDDSHKRTNIEDSTEDQHQNIPPLIFILFSTANPVIYIITYFSIDMNIHLMLHNIKH